MGSSGLHRDRTEHVVDRPADVHADPRLAGQLVEPQPAAPGERVPRRQHDVERLAQQRYHGEPRGRCRGGALVAVGDDHVVVGGQHGYVRWGHVDVAAAQVDVRKRGHPPQQSGQQHPGPGREQRHPHLTARQAAQPVDRGLCPGQRGEHLLRLGHQRLAGGGEAQPAAGRLGQRHPDLRGQRPQLLRDRRRRERQRGGHGRHRPAVRQLAEHPQPCHVHEATLQRH